MAAHVVDLSIHRADGFAWIGPYRDRVGHDVFDEAYARAWKFLDGLPVGHHYRIDSLPECKVEIFIKCLCLYCYDHTDAGLLISDDFRTVTRLQPVVITTQKERL